MTFQHSTVAVETGSVAYICQKFFIHGTMVHSMVEICNSILRDVYFYFIPFNLKKVRYAP